MRRDDGQMFERPFAPHGLDAFRRHDGEQMADRRRKDVMVAFVKVVYLLESAERLGDVAGDGRFLRNDECFAHLCASACTPGAANMRRKNYLSNRTRSGATAVSVGIGSFGTDCNNKAAAWFFNGKSLYDRQRPESAPTGRHHESHK